MHRSDRRLLAVLALASALLAAGCLAQEAASPSAGSAEADASSTNASSPNASTGVVASSNPEIPVLGLATYDGVPRERVAPMVPGNTTPVPCFRPNGTDGLDVYLVVTGEHHPDLVPDRDVTVRSVSLVACARRPDGTRWDEANEPPWVLLAGWTEAPAADDYLGDRGFSDEPANVTIETTPDGYRFQAETPNGTAIARGRFTPSPVGIPNFLTCEPSSFRGRVLQDGPSGLAALTWNKTEAACPAQAEITWPPTGPIAEVLGPAHAPSYAIDSQVEDARYWYRVFGGT